jgi:hypothetical protein
VGAVSAFEQQAKLAGDLFTAAAAIWGFYGATQVVLLGYVVFPAKNAPKVAIPIIPLAVCLSLFFIVNLVGIATLQTASVELLSSTLPPDVLFGLRIMNVVTLILHAALDVAAVWLLRSTLVGLNGPRAPAVQAGGALG